MQNGVSAAAAAMEQAVRRLEGALEQREAAFRDVQEHNAALAAELNRLREEVQAARQEAAQLQERAALVDALREELAQIQIERGEGDMRPVAGAAADQEASTAELHRMEQALAARDSEIAALKDECDALRGQLASSQAAREMLSRVAANNGIASGDDAAALRAELAAAKASQAEMQAFQVNIARRIEATMSRLRAALDAEAAQ